MSAGEAAVPFLRPFRILLSGVYHYNHRPQAILNLEMIHNHHLKWEFFINSIRDIHEAVRIRCLAGSSSGMVQ